MKTLTFTPRLAKHLLNFSLAVFLLFSALGAALGQDTTTVSAGATDTVKTLTKEQIKRHYAVAHIVSISDTINVIVNRVIDGDTFEVVSCLDCKDYISVRVLGIDTPEKDRKPKKQIKRQMKTLRITEDELLTAGKLITLEAKRLVENKQIKLIRDFKEMNLDMYYRPLRHVILTDGMSYAKWIKAKGYNAGKE